MLETSELFLSFVRRGLGFFFALLICLFALALTGHAQSAGTVGIYTREVPVFVAQNTSTFSGILPDFGFGCSFLSFQNSTFMGTIDLEWSPPVLGSPSLGPFYTLTQASYPSADSGYHTLQLGGYFPNVRAAVVVNGGSVSAWFTASSGPCPLFGSGVGTNGQTSPINCDHNLFLQSLTSGGGLLVAPIQSGDTVVLCAATISFNGATSAGNVQVYYSTLVGCGVTSQVVWEAFTTALTPQLFNVPIQMRPLVAATTPYLCWSNNSGATAIITYSYASVHGL